MTPAPRHPKPRPSAPAVAIVIVNWNGAQDTLECLESCERLVDRSTYAIVVVDNGSTDGSAALIRNAHPSATVIEAPRNLGYAGGNNLGVGWALDARSEFIWLLNNDTRVHETAGRELIQCLRANHDAGVAGSKILYAAEPDRLWFAGGFFSLSGLARHRGLDQLDRGQFDTGGPVGYITGCSLLIRAEVVRQIGLLREDYFLYYEDVEWNMRAKRLGWSCVYAPASRVWHKVGASLTQTHTPRAYYYATRNWLHLTGRSDPKRLPLALGHVAGAAFLSLVRGDVDMASARVGGAIDAARGRLGP